MASRQVRGIVREIERFSARRAGRIAVVLTRRLASPPPVGTPRDTHFHSVNWIPTIGQPFDGTVGERPRSGVREFRRASRVQQRAAIALVDQTYRSLDQGSVFVTNNAPAIQRLNNGYSGQTPSGFVQRAMSAAVSQVDREFGGASGRFRR